jgi:hypothetical protein
MYGVELEDSAMALLDFYRGKYREYFGIEAIIENESLDRTFCKDLIRQLGMDKAHSVIVQFLKSEENWFKKKGHALISLKGNIAMINLEMGRKAPAPISTQIKIMDPVVTGIWYFKNCGMTRKSYQCKVVDKKYYAVGEGDTLTELSELDIEKLVKIRLGK